MNKGKENLKAIGDGHDEQIERNLTCDDINILVLNDATTHAKVNMVFSPSHI